MANTTFSGPVVSTNGFKAGSTTLAGADFAAIQALVSGDGAPGLGGAWKKVGLWKKRARTLDDMTGANAAYSVTSGSLTKSDSTDFVKTELGCSNALKLSGISSFARVLRTIPSTNLTGVINIWVYLTEEPALTAGISVYFSGDAMVTSAVSSWSTSHGARKGWNCLSWHVSEDGTTTSSGNAPVISGGTFPNSMTSLRFEFNNCHLAGPNGAVPIIYIGGIFYAGEGQPAVMLNWDDSYSSQWDIFNIFRRFNIRGAISVIPVSIGSGTGLTLAQLQEMYDWGWDIVNHTTQSIAGNLSGDSAALVQSKIEGGRDWLIANGFTRTANVLVWPENNYRSTVAGVDMTAIAVSTGARICRGSQRRDMALSQGLDNPLRFASADFGGRTLASALKLLDSAELYKQLNVIYGHKIVGTDTSPASGAAAPADTLEWNRSAYIAFAENLADRITAGTIINVTYSDIFDKFRV